MSNRAVINGVAKLFDGELVSVEILPGGLDDWQSIEIPPESPRPSEDFPCVLVEGNLGIPTKVVQQLYLTAIALPWRSLQEPHAAVVATTVILILNPAHQTALNVRKRLIKSGHIHPQKELRYLELLLCGLKDCAKQSIIWDHRRWCLTQVYGRIGQITTPYHVLEHFVSGDEAGLFPDMGSDDIRKEMGIVYRTCETYPRNYYAWNYLHWLINGTFSSFHRSFNETRRMDFTGVLVDAYAELRAWVECHPSDYSAVHQLCQIQTIMDHLSAAGALTNVVEEGRASHSTLAGHCLSLLSSFPSHESLWMYLRLAMNEPRSHILDRVESDFNSNLHAAKLLAWCRRGRD